MRTSFFMYALTLGQKAPNSNIAEVGVYKGENAMAMLMSGNTFGKLYLIDSYTPNSETLTDDEGNQLSPEGADKLIEGVQKKLEAFQRRIELIRKPSVEAAKDFRDGFFRYVYIDGSHDYRSVKDDIEAWYPKVMDGGGMLAGHDFWKTDVYKAVQGFVKEKNLELYGVGRMNKGNLEEPYSNIANFMDWWIFKY